MCCGAPPLAAEATHSVTGASTVSREALQRIPKECEAGESTAHTLHMITCSPVHTSASRGAVATEHEHEHDLKHVSYSSLTGYVIRSRSRMA